MDGIRDRDRRDPRHPGRGHGAARRPADRQADPGPARRARSRAVARGRQEGRGDACQAPGDPGSRRRPAAARHRLEGPCRSGGGRQVRRQSRDRRHRAATGHQRHQGHRIPPGRQRQGRRYPGALPRGSPQPRSDGRAARADAVRLGADQQFRRAAAGAARRIHQPRRRQPRHDGVGERGAGRADRQGAGGDRQGARDGRPRPGRHLAAEGRGRRARQGRAPS